MADTAKRIEWPELEVARLPKQEDAERAEAIFTRILTSRAPDDWRQHDTILCANLANVTVELDKLSQLVARAGWVVPAGKNGTQFTRTPLLDPIQHLTTRQLSLCRALGLTGTPVDVKTVTSNARLAQESRAARGPGFGLLAGEDDNDDFSVGSAHAAR